MKDRNGNNIGDKILMLSTELDVDGKPKYAGCIYITAREFFRDYDHPDYTTWKSTAAKISGNYLGWQTIDRGPYWQPDYLQDDHGINECGVDKHSYSQVGYWEQAYKQPFYIKFIKDQNGWLANQKWLGYRHSPEVKRMLLKAHDFTYSGTRYFHKPYDTKPDVVLGYKYTNRGAEIWINQYTGVVVTFKVSDQIQLDDPELTTVMLGDERNRVCHGFTSGGCEKNCYNHLVTILQTYPLHYNQPWNVLGLSKWNLQMKGIDSIQAYDYNELGIGENVDPTINYNAAKNQIRKEMVELSKQYPLIKDVCW